MFWLWFAAGLVVVLGLVGTVVGAALARGEFSASLPFTILGSAMGGALGACTGLILGIAPLTDAQTTYNERTLECEVEGKDRGGREDDMRIYTSCGVFINVDSIWQGKHNSADWWAKWKEGETYRFVVAGWRLGFTSDFPNIFGWEHVK